MESRPVIWRRLDICCRLAGALMLAAAAYGQPAPAQLAGIEMLQNTLAAVAEQVRPSVVAIIANRPMVLFDWEGTTETQPAPSREAMGRVPTGWVPSVGSGMVLTPDGWILTNEHVIRGAQAADITCLLTSGEKYQAREVNTDPRRDLAVIRIDAEGLRPVRLGDLAEVRQGHFAIVMGNPYGSASEGQGSPAMSFGVISALGRGLTQQLDPLATERYYGNLIQTDARINPGNSGGPLLNIRGEVIGINTAIATRSGASEGVGYAIPIDQQTRDIIQRLIRGEEIEYGFLGVSLRTPSAADVEASGAPGRGGAAIAAVEFNTPAAIVGLQPGDVITSFAGQSIGSPDELIRLVGAARIGRPVELIYYRAGRSQQVSIVPWRRKMPPPNTFSWRGARLAYPDWEVCLTYRLPPDVRGAVVVAVEPDSPAAQAGLEPGQVIQQIEGAPVHGVRRLDGLTGGMTGPARLTVLGHPDSEVILP